MAGDGVQVAGLFLGLSARTDKLEKDLAKAKSAVRDAATGIAKEGERASGFFEKVGLSGHEATSAFKNLTAGLLLSAGQMEGVNEKAKAVTETLGAFIAGGPIAGGIVAATSAFKMFAGQLNEADEEARKRLAKMTEDSVALAKRMADEWKKAGQAASDAFVAATRGIFKRGDEVRNAGAIAPDEMKRLASELQEAQDALVALRGPEVTGRRRLTADELQRVLALELQIQAIEDRIWNLKLDEAKAAVDAANKLHQDEDAMLAEQKRQEELAALRLDTTRLGGKLSDLLGDEPSPETKGKAEQIGKTIGEHVAKGAGAAMAEELPKQIDPLLESLGQTVGQGLGDLIFDGITTGGENAAQIFQSIWQSMLRQAINSWVQSGISQLLGGLFGGGGGGGGGIISTFTGALVGGGDPLAGGSFPAGVSNEAGFNAWLDGGLPGHATGGHFTDPHLAMIAEGGEGEWVIPDSKVGAFVRAQGGGSLVGDIHVHTSNDVGAIAMATSELVRRKILTSGPHRGAVQKAANNTRFR